VILPHFERAWFVGRTPTTPISLYLKKRGCSMMFFTCPTLVSSRFCTLSAAAWLPALFFFSRQFFMLLWISQFRLIFPYGYSIFNKYSLTRCYQDIIFPPSELSMRYYYFKASTLFFWAEHDQMFVLFLKKVSANALLSIKSAAISPNRCITIIHV